MYPVLRDKVSMDIVGKANLLEKDFLSPDNKYFAQGAEGDEVELSCDAFMEVLHADGTHPLQIPEELLNRLKEAKIISTSRYIFNGLTSQLVLFAVGRRGRKYRPVCKVLNAVLPVLSVLMFLAACLLRKGHGGEYAEELMSIPMYYLLVVISLAMHETGHLVSGITYGFRLDDVGLLLALGFVPCGAYVSARESQKHGSRLEQMQFYLAGIEANLLAAAMFLLISLKPFSFDRTFAMAANTNVLLAIVNILPVFDLDGERAFSALLEVESLCEEAILFLTCKSYRRIILTDLQGFGYAALYVFILLSILAIAGFILWNIVSLIAICADIDLPWLFLS